MNYHPSFAARARDMCYLGAPMSEIASLLGVSVSTLVKWREEYPEFDFAWKDGAAHADAKAAKSLFSRVTGYEHTKVKKKYSADGELVEVLEETVHVAPDVPACIFWLTNRRPDLWHQRIEHTIPAGSALPVDAVTDEEAARRIAFTLAKALLEDKSRTIDHDDSGES